MISIMIAVLLVDVIIGYCIEQKGLLNKNVRDALSMYEYCCEVFNIENTIRNKSKRNCSMTHRSNIKKILTWFCLPVSTMLVILLAKIEYKIAKKEEQKRDS